MDKSKIYRLFYDEAKNRWVCESENLQESGDCYDEKMENSDKDLAPVLAVADCAGYDIGIISEELTLNTRR